MTLQQLLDRLQTSPTILGTMGQAWERAFADAPLRPTPPSGTIRCLDGTTIDITASAVILAFERGDGRMLFALAEAAKADAKATTFLLLNGPHGPFCRPTARPWAEGDPEPFTTTGTDGVKRTVTALWPSTLLRGLAAVLSR